MAATLKCGMAQASAGSSECICTYRRDEWCAPSSRGTRADTASSHLTLSHLPKHFLRAPGVHLHEARMERLMIGRLMLTALLPAMLQFSKLTTVVQLPE